MRPAARLLGAVLLAVAGLAPRVQAQDEMRVEQVRFAAGATGASLSGTIVGRDSVLYKIGAEAGQRMTIALSSNNTATYFNVYEPGRGPGDEALAVSEMTGPMVPDLNRFDGVLPLSGEYSVSVYLYRNAARDGQRSDYRLEISVTGDAGKVVQGDFADSLQGGPDFWRVRVGTGLNLRSGPSAGAGVLLELSNGQNLRNLGCRMAEGRRWCRVATLGDPGIEGWAAGEYLVEGDGGAAVPLTDSGQDALVPGTPYNATGQVECREAPGAAPRMCDFGVIREGSGTGTVTVTLPDGRSRAIFYQRGAPVAFDQSEADGAISFEVQRQEDGYRVVIGPASFVIPDAVIYGG